MDNFNNLKDFRQDHDLTQAQLAQLLGIVQEQYHRYEAGRYPMPIHHYKKIALFYNISVDYLCGLCINPKTLTGEPYQISKSYSIRQNGKITNNFK